MNALPCLTVYFGIWSDPERAYWCSVYRFQIWKCGDRRCFREFLAL